MFGKILKFIIQLFEKIFPAGLAFLAGKNKAKANRAKNDNESSKKADIAIHNFDTVKSIRDWVRNKLRR